MKRLTQEEIVDHVINHFKTNPRGLADNGVGCTYINDQGHRCAHSICVKDEIVEENKNGDTRYATAGGIINVYGDEAHKPEFQGHSLLFWYDIQALHDEKRHWEKNNEGGSDLTLKGEVAAQRIKNKSYN